MTIGKDNAYPPVVLIVGRSDAGKTTLIEKLIPELIKLGLRVGSIKHDVHGFDIDHPGKDSWRHKKAGAEISVISSPFKLAVVQDTQKDFTLDELRPFFKGLDLIVTEGYKRESRPKVEIFRSEAYPEPLCLDDENLIAMVTDEKIDPGTPVFKLNDAAGLALYLKNKFAP